MIESVLARDDAARDDDVERHNRPAPKVSLGASLRAEPTTACILDGADWLFGDEGDLLLILASVTNAAEAVESRGANWEARFRYHSESAMRTMLRAAGQHFGADVQV